MRVQGLCPFPVLTYNAFYFAVTKSKCHFSFSVQLVQQKVRAAQYALLGFAWFVMKDFKGNRVVFLDVRGGVAGGCLMHGTKRRGVFVILFFELIFMMFLLCGGL